MRQTDAYDFTKLYRAAFAERNPDRKLVLLGQVQQAIENWHQTVDFSMRKKPAEDERPSRIQLTA